jgi:DNA-3-methyladenine glycosylase
VIPPLDLAGDPVVAAERLIGWTLLVDGVGGPIVETEAYRHDDPASHAFSGQTARNEVMFGPPGHAYVYLIYGMHHCMNVVVEPEGRAAAVLLRALEPVANIEGRTRGPGLLCRALHIDRRHNGVDLLGDTLFVCAGDATPVRIVKRPRVGVDYAGHWARRLLRFYVKGSPFVSKP